MGLDKRFEGGRMEGKIEEETCPKCHGTGQFKNEAEKKTEPCAQCRGTGKIRRPG